MKLNDAWQKYHCLAIIDLASSSPARSHCRWTLAAALSLFAFAGLPCTADNISEGEVERIVAEGKKLDLAEKRKEALQLLDKATSKYPVSEPLHTLRATIRSEERNFEGAVADLNQSITLSPKKKELFVQRAKILLRVSQLEAAQSDINHALKLSPDDNDAITLRGGLYFKLDRYDRAMEDLDRAITRDPKNFSAYFYRGAVKYKKRDLRGAIEDFTKSMQLDPKHTYAHQSRGCAYGELGEYKKALADFNLAATAGYVNEHLYFNRGRVYRLMKEYNKALTDFNLAIRLGLAEKDLNAPVFLERAMVYFATGRIDQALIDVNHSIRTHPQDPRGHMLRAQIYKRMGNVNEELKEVAKARELGAKVSGVRPSQSPGPD